MCRVVRGMGNEHSVGVNLPSMKVRREELQLFARNSLLEWIPIPGVIMIVASFFELPPARTFALISR